MNQRFAVPLLPVFVFCLNLFCASAGFLGGLKKFNPNKIVATVTDTAPEVAHAVSKETPKTLVSDVLSTETQNELTTELQSSNPADLSKVINRPTAKVANLAVGRADKVVESAEWGGSATHSSQISILPTTRPATTSTPERATNQYASDAGVCWDSALAAAKSANLETANEEMRKVRQSLLKDTSTDIDVAIPSDHDVEDAFNKASESNPHVSKALTNTGHGFGWVQDALDTHGAVATVEKVIRDNGPKVSEMIEKTKPDDGKRATGSSQRIVETVHQMEQMFPGWQWALVAICVAACMVLAGYQLTMKCKRDQRSPTLLLDAESNMWPSGFMAPGGARAEVAQRPTQSEPLFRQF